MYRVCAVEDRILCHFLDAVDAELHAHAHQQKTHDPGHGIDAGGAEDLADRIRQLQYAPADQTHQGKRCDHGAVDGEAVVLVGQLGNLGAPLITSAMVPGPHMLGMVSGTKAMLWLISTPLV